MRDDRPNPPTGPRKELREFCSPRGISKRDPITTAICHSYKLFWRIRTSNILQQYRHLVGKTLSRRNVKEKVGLGLPCLYWWSKGKKILPGIATVSVTSSGISITKNPICWYDRCSAKPCPRSPRNPYSEPGMKIFPNMTSFGIPWFFRLESL